MESPALTVYRATVKVTVRQCDGLKSLLRFGKQSPFVSVRADYSTCVRTQLKTVAYVFVGANVVASVILQLHVGLLVHVCVCECGTTYAYVHVRMHRNRCV